MKKLFFLFLPLYFWGQVPTYYSSIDFTAQPEVIKNELSDLIINTHTTNLTYTPGVWNTLKETDLDPDDDGKVFLLYGHNDDDNDYKTDRTRNKYFICNFSGCNDDGYWNREHVYPKSLGTPNLGTENAGADAHALRAVDAGMNSSRSNRKFAEGTGISHITNEGNWYPGDEWKGDVARMMMYMHLRYPTQTPANNVAISTNTNSTEMPDIFLQWNAEDPVSEYEMQRNNYLENAQGNRNPFIDNPYLATKIWGGVDAEETWGVLSTTESNVKESAFVLYPNPATDIVYFDYNEKPTATYINNASGQIIKNDNNLNDNKVELPKTKGIYFITFEFKHQKVTKKVIVQ